MVPALVAACNALQIFFIRIVRSKALVYNSFFWFFFFSEQPFYGNYSTLDSNKFLTRLPTRQDGVEKVEKGL